MLFAMFCMPSQMRSSALHQYLQSPARRRLPQYGAYLFGLGRLERHRLRDRVVHRSLAQIRCHVLGGQREQFARPQSGLRRVDIYASQIRIAASVNMVS